MIAGGCEFIGYRPYFKVKAHDVQFLNNVI
jgi:hypothetical protein